MKKDHHNDDDAVGWWYCSVYVVGCRWGGWRRSKFEICLITCVCWTMLRMSGVWLLLRFQCDPACYGGGDSWNTIVPVIEPLFPNSRISAFRIPMPSQSQPMISYLFDPCGPSISMLSVQFAKWPLASSHLWHYYFCVVSL